MNWRKRLAEILARMAEIKTETTEIEAIEAPTDEDATRAEGLLTEWDELEAERVQVAEKVERLDRIAAAATDPVNVEPAFHAPNVNVRTDPFENLELVERGAVSLADMSSRALAAIEATPRIGDAEREHAARLVETVPMAARHALLTGSPEYQRAFEKVLQYPEAFQGMFTNEEAAAFRTAMSTTVGNGGYAIPFLLDPSVVLSSSGSTNPFRQVSKIVRGTSNKWQGITSAGVTAYWKGEASAFTDGSPTLAQPSITAYLGSAYVLGSYEVFEDTNLASELPRLIQDAKDQLEADAFAVGSGSAAPFGVVTSTTAVTASRVAPTTGGTFTSASIADVYKVVNALAPRFRSKSTWLANFATYTTIRSMSAAAQGSSFWANLGAAQPEQLLGLPIVEASAVVSAATTGSNILLCGDFSNYVIFDRIGTTIEYIQNVVDGSGVPTGQRGWVAHWRTGADVMTANAFRVLKL